MVVYVSMVVLMDGDYYLVYLNLFDVKMMMMVMVKVMAW